MLWGISGRRGCGKTALAIQASYWLARHGRLVFAFDPCHQWPDRDRVSIEHLRSSERIGMLSAVSDCEPDELCELAKETRNVTLFLDEMDLVCSANSWKSDAAREIVRRGRHYQVGIVGTFQRAASIHGDFRALATRISVFSTTHPEDIERISKSLSPEHAHAVKNVEARLGEFWYADWPGNHLFRMGFGSRAPEARPISSI